MLYIRQSGKVILRSFLSWDLSVRAKPGKSKRRTFQAKGTPYAEVLVWEGALIVAETKQRLEEL